MWTWGINYFKYIHLSKALWCSCIIAVHNELHFWQEDARWSNEFYTIWCLSPVVKSQQINICHTTPELLVWKVWIQNTSYKYSSPKSSLKKSTRFQQTITTTWNKIIPVTHWYFWHTTFFRPLLKLNIQSWKEFFWILLCIMVQLLAFLYVLQIKTFHDEKYDIFFQSESLENQQFITY